MPSFLARLLLTGLLAVVPLLGALALAQPLDISTMWPAYSAENVDEGEFGGALRIPLGYYEPFESLNIIGNLTASSLLVSLYPTLMVYDPFSGLSNCWLCTSYEVSEDGMDVIFTIREGIEWTDGSPLTAHDIAVTARIVSDPESETNYGARMRVGEGTITYTAQDDHTLAMHLPEPLPESTWKNLTRLPALPAHIFGPPYDEGGIAAVEELYPLDSTDIVSAGAWRFGSYSEVGGLVLLENREGNWVTDAYGNKLPYLDEFHRFGLGESNASELLLAGKADIVVDVTSGSLIDDLREAGNEVVPLQRNSSQMDMVIPNFVHPDPRMRELMQTRDFRRALSMLVPRERYAEELYGLRAEPVYNWNDREGYRYLPYPIFGYDSAAAHELLEGIGLERDSTRSACPGGCYAFADGTPLVLELMHFDREGQNQGGAFVAAALREGGLEIEDLPLSVDEAVDRVYYRDTEVFREFDLFFAFRGAAIDGREFYRLVFDVAADFRYWGIGPEVGVPPADLQPWEVRLSELAAVMESDQPLAMQVAAAAEATVIFAQELPMIPIVVKNRYQAYAGNLRNTFDQVSEDYKEPYGQGPLLQLLNFE
ncbi:MAG: ABC transporter substrate-binding protein [Trueperaceae bacterium]